MSKIHGRKGKFGSVRLGVTKRYLYPSGRRRMVVIGAVAVAAILVIVAGDFYLGGGALVSAGPLSSSHAHLEARCESCHDRFRSAVSANCATCHERFDVETGAYTLATHYLYQTDDTTRLDNDHAAMPCSTCHVEHVGREASIDAVRDSRCLSCHAGHTFPSDHPPFAAAGVDEDPKLKFPHITHVKLLPQFDDLPLAGDGIEATCLYCHRPDATGRGFEPIRFADHCTACHLGVDGEGNTLPNLPYRGYGVLTLGELRDREPDNPAWVAMSDRLFTERRGKLLRRQVEHEDRWVMANLAYFASLLPDVPGDVPAAAAAVSKSCDGCHEIVDYSILPTHGDQRTLVRSRFDHGAHVLLRGCLDCHAKIPIAEGVEARGGEAFPTDRAETQNLPNIDVCRDCHTASLGTSACMTCHDFHPRKGNRSTRLIARTAP